MCLLNFILIKKKMLTCFHSRSLMKQRPSTCFDPSTHAHFFHSAFNLRCGAPGKKAKPKLCRRRKCEFPGKAFICPFYAFSYKLPLLTPSPSPSTPTPTFTHLLVSVAEEPWKEGTKVKANKVILRFRKKKEKRIEKICKICIFCLPSHFILTLALFFKIKMFRTNKFFQAVRKGNFIYCKEKLNKNSLLHLHCFYLKNCLELPRIEIKITLIQS